MTDLSSEKVAGAIAAATGAASNLPAPVQAGFIKAAGRLSGGVLLTPGAWLRRPAQAVEDKTDARSLVTRRIAQAVAERAAADPEIVERAMESLVREEFRKQTNKERVAQSTAETLSEPGPSTPSPEAEVDEDWMNVFVRYAEDASSERMQKLWGRVLAGEIRKPGAFSLSTIRFLSELDTQTAQMFEDIAPQITGSFIFFEPDKDNVLFNRCLELESAGLVTVGAGMLSKQCKTDENGRYHLVGSRMCLEVHGTKDTGFAVPVIALTRLGREIAHLLPTYDESEQFRRVSRTLESVTGLQKTLLCRLLYEHGQATRAVPVELLWERPAK
jgi:hypothetical protein